MPYLQIHQEQRDDILQIFGSIYQDVFREAWQHRAFEKLQGKSHGI